MNKKGIIISGLLTVIISFLLTISFITDIADEKADKKDKEIISNNVDSIYQVYLDGEKIGLINSEEKLYDLINQEQIEIKKKYNVDHVYPPKGFQIVETNTYNNQLSTIEKVYDTIKDDKEFTIKGYTVTIKSGEEGAEPTYIYVIDKTIFEQAVENVVETFIGSTRYEQFKNGTQPEIVDTGYIIEKMYFKDEISIKESYISVNERIYTNVTDLTKYLLFGNNSDYKEYVVSQGDTVARIAEASKLNVSELLIANEELKSEDTLLAIGQKLNIALIDPVLTLIYEELIVSDQEQPFQTVYEDDPNQYVNYKVTKQEGAKGINRVTSRAQFINGEQNQGGAIISSVVIKPVQNKIIVKGTKKYAGISGSYVDTGDTWGWPTNQPCVITSHYGYRWGALHEGMDISGTGYNSPIYAVLDGTVVSAQYGGMVGSSAGYNVVIQHDNGYYTVYAHMVKGSLRVTAGQRVSRGQQIGGMGATGVVTGTHLHFGLYYGKPYHGGKPVNPRHLWGI